MRPPHPVSSKLLIVLATATLAACGGGGGDDSEGLPTTPAATAEGAYGGTLAGDTANNTFSAVVLENGDVWAIYGTALPSGVLAVTGFLQGSGNSTDSRYTSSDLRDFGFEPPVTGTANAEFNASANTMSGSFQFGSNTVRFAGGPINGGYDYAAAAQLTQVSGAWSLNALSGEGINIMVGGDGSFTGQSALGCAISGKLTPRASGKNVFDVTLQFGPAPCAVPNQSAAGIALSYPISGRQQLIFAGTDSSRRYGTAGIGIR